MKRLSGIIFILIFSFSVFAQNGSNPILLGKIKKEELMKEPYSKWFNKEYAYEYNKEVVAELKKANWSGASIQIFLGTWCGDSHREVPRMLRILEDAGCPSDKIELIAVNTGEGVHKQSPNGEEKGKYIFKVPTFIFYHEEEELGRIVEFPVMSLERDLLKIASAKRPAYSPNYRSYPFIIDWLKEGLLTDNNISVNGLAEQIRFVTQTAGELTSAAYVLAYQNKKQEASTLCKIATRLFPETVNYYTCAYIYNENEEQENALQAIKKYIATKSDKEAIDDALELYDKIKINQK